MPPFLAKPKLNASAPAFQLSAAGVAPVRTTALAKRAPSTWKARPRSCASAPSARRLVGGVDEAVFGGVGDREGVRLGLVDVVADRGERGGGGLRRQLGADAFGEHQLGAMGVEFGRAAFVVLDVGVAVADDRAVRRAQGGEGERIGRGAGGDPQGRDLGLEQIGEDARRGAGSTRRRHRRCRRDWPRRARPSLRGRRGRHCRRRNAWGAP